MTASVLTLGIVAAAVIGVAAQQRDTPAPVPAGTGAISGVVVSNDEAAQPLHRTIVTISGSALHGGSRQTVTNDQGEFAFAGLAAGGYSLSASKAAWLTTYYGSKRPGRPAYGGFPIQLTAGQALAHITLKLLHGSAINGTVRDPFGRPASGTIRIMQVRIENGERHLSAVIGASMNAAVIDDRGEYRLYGLPPGDYLVSATPGAETDDGTLHQTTTDDVAAARGGAPGAAPASPPVTRSDALPSQGPGVKYTSVYYPGATSLSGAAVVTVGRAEDKAGVDITLQLVPAAAVSGTITMPGGQPIAGGLVRLIGRDDSQSASADGQPALLPIEIGTAAFAELFPDGRFIADSVAPGQYTVFARAVDRSQMPQTPQASPQVLAAMAAAGAQATLWAAEDITVDGHDITNVALTLQPGLTIHGRLVFDGTAALPADLSRVRIALTPAGSTASPAGAARVESNGEFTFASVTPGRYRVTAQALGLTVVSANVGDVDALDLPFEVKSGEDTPAMALHLSNGSSSISGSLLDASGAPVPGDLVVVFSTDRRLWGSTGRRLLPPITPDGAGGFRAMVPPGEYFIAVATDVDQNDVRDASVLEELAASAVRVTVAAGETKVQALRIGGR